MVGLQAGWHEWAARARRSWPRAWPKPQPLAPYLQKPQVGPPNISSSFASHLACRLYSNRQHPLVLSWWLLVQPAILHTACYCSQLYTVQYTGSTTLSYQQPVVSCYT